MCQARKAAVCGARLNVVGNPLSITALRVAAVPGSRALLARA